MEAKDTVMNDNQIHDAWCSFDGENITDQKHSIMVVRDGHRAIAKKQAEISWHARDSEIKEAFKAGMKEVVECLKEHREGVYPKSVKGITVYMQLFGFEQDEWHNRLKEWKIE